MCRICGRVVKCIFDSMPSKFPTPASTRSFVTAAKAGSTHLQQNHVTSKSLVNSAFNTDRASSISLPTFLLPLRARLHQAASTQAAVSNTPNAAELPPSMLQTSQPKLVYEIPSSDITLKDTPTSAKPLVLSKSVQKLLPLLEAQKPHYITAHIHRFPYLVTAGDTLRLPFHMHGVNSGDILRLNRASILGSRDYTLKAGTSSTETYDQKRTGEPNYLDERLFEVRARVLGIETGPMMTVEKTKRRNRKVKTVRSKHKYTMLKVMEVRAKTLEELKMEKATLLLES